MTCHLLPRPISTALEPLSIVNVHVISSVFGRAQSTLAMAFVIQEVPIVLLLACAVQIIPGPVALARE